ncbi:transglutaminase-like domain-containing protein [Enhygromyxa salina]|uniref:Protein-glutamine gamma-glutamyltransferase n=1 Tax=Enhygromyxa salina TaxID=215803 RepID=A0A2S9YHR5_9BACT|nr:transglutaminase-like domain-containing protein [Enhygromyxa salina]PRQ04582.1 Protein-glutamine gamma-glutamyltransferase [Enhygromyxa salina]
MGRRELQQELERLEAEHTGRPVKPPTTMGERLLAWLRASRHLIRAGAMAMAALALAWGIATSAGLVAAMLGAVAGVASGELLARTKTRLIALVVAIVAAAGLGWWVADLVTEVRVIPAAIGPGATLGLSSVLRFFVLALGVTGALRVMAARHKALIGLELAVVGASVASMFASHREGVIARPLWLSDWAWQHGYDPADVLLTIGAISVVVLASLLVAESERRVSLASIGGLLVIVMLALLLLQVEGLPQPQANSDLGLTESQIGDPPKPTESGGYGPGGDKKPDEGDGEGQEKTQDKQGQGGGGQQQQDQQGQGGGQGQQQQDQQGQGGGQGQQQDQQGQGGGQQQQQDQQGQGQGQQQQDQQGQGQGQQQQDQQGGQGQQQQQPNLDQQPSEGTKPAPMAVVLLGDDYSPPTQAFYFRQDAWSHFNGSRLVAPVRPDVDKDILRRFPARPTNVPEIPPEALHTTVHADVVLLAKHAQPFALESAISMKPELNPNPARFLRAYSFVSLAPDYEFEQLIGHAPGDSTWTDAQWQFYTALPDDPRYRDLANELIQELPAQYGQDPFMRALAIKLWMDRELTYSTAERHAGVAEPTGDFLFGNRIGYCVHFAHAAVYMWRSLGIPARVGTGYHITEDERRGSTIVIRGSDAHAWPELYLEGVGWVILDIAAQQNLDPPGTPMDDDLADLLGDMARNETDEAGEDGEEPAERRNFGRDIAFGFLFFLLIAVLVLYAAKVWRRVIPRYAAQKHLPRVGYRAAIDMLSDAGLTRRYGETREAFARRLDKRAPSLAGLTSMHVAAALGDPSVPMPERPEFNTNVWHEGLAGIRGELPLSAPLWRRALGVIDPTTVLRAR